MASCPELTNAVGMAQALGMQQRSLSHLLSLHCGVESDKSLQRSDWRSRPLAPEQVRWRSDDQCGDAPA